jgi:hypothetical protein
VSDTNAARQFKHGQSGSRTYVIWSGMLKRCNNPRARAYLNYGGRGIKVCERWYGFAAFFTDMGESPPGLMIERLDNDRGYEPGNCIWALRSVQNRNRRNVYLTPELVREIDRRCEAGESQASIASDLGVAQTTVSHARTRRSWVGV